MIMEQINLEQDVLNEIQGTPDGVGFDVALTQIYDNIREARFEEDENLSQGIWERDLKKADWKEVQDLSLKALKNHSKDFQIVAWLMESLSVQYGFQGICEGIRVLTEFTKKYCEIGYPRTEDNGSDDEQKQRILEWIYQSLAVKSKLIPLISTEESGQISLYSYEYATDLKKTINRSPGEADSILDSAKRNKVKTLDEIQKSIQNMGEAEKSGLFEVLTEARHKCEIFRDTLQNLPNLCEEMGEPFYDLLANIEKIIV